MFACLSATVFYCNQMDDCVRHGITTMMMMMVFMVMGGRIICLCVALLVMAIGIVRHTHSVSVGDPFDPHFFFFLYYKRITTPQRREALTVDRRLKAQREISRSIKSPVGDLHYTTYPLPPCILLP